MHQTLLYMSQPAFLGFIGPRICRFPFLTREGARLFVLPLTFLLSHVGERNSGKAGFSETCTGLQPFHLVGGQLRETDDLGPLAERPYDLLRRH